MSDDDNQNDPVSRWRSLRSKLLLKYGDISASRIIDTVNLMIHKLPKKSLRKTLGKYHNDVYDIFGMEPEPLLDDGDEDVPHLHGRKPIKNDHHVLGLSSVDTNLGEKGDSEFLSAHGPGSAERSKVRPNLPLRLTAAVAAIPILEILTNPALAAAVRLFSCMSRRFPDRCAQTAPSRAGLTAAAARACQPPRRRQCA